MLKLVLDKWYLQDDIVKHYCHACGTYISYEEIQNSEGEQYFCSKNRISSPNVLLMDDRLFKAVFETLMETCIYAVKNVEKIRLLIKLIICEEVHGLSVVSALKEIAQEKNLMILDRKKLWIVYHKTSP